MKTGLTYLMTIVLMGYLAFTMGQDIRTFVLDQIAEASRAMEIRK